MKHDSSNSKSSTLKHRDPDHGGTIHEMEHKFDKGYVSDDEYAEMGGKFPEAHMRGNEYMKHQNEILARDKPKLIRNKFSKIA
jgi:hypothetical protein